MRSRKSLRRGTTFRDRRLTTILLRPLCNHIDIWHTHYFHIMENHGGVVEWFKGSALRPFLAPLDPAVREKFTANYADEIQRAYPARFDGRVILKLPRLFILAVR